MDFHRDGRGGYVGESSMRNDASATIERAPWPGGRAPWVVTVTVFGEVVDRRGFWAIADAKWHATAVEGVAVLPGFTSVEDYPHIAREGFPVTF